MTRMMGAQTPRGHHSCPDSPGLSPPSLHSHFLSLFTHIFLSPDFGANFYYLGHHLAGCGLGKFLRNPRKSEAEPPSPTPALRAQHPTSFCICQRQHQASFQASGMRESCQQKSKIMQLNYIGARRGFGDHQSFFLDEEVEKSGYVQRSLRVNDKCLP